MDKNSLMASLMADGPEQDLFGDVPIDDPTPALDHTPNANGLPANSPIPTVPQATMTVNGEQQPTTDGMPPLAQPEPQSNPISGGNNNILLANVVATAATTTTTDDAPPPATLPTSITAPAPTPSVSDAPPAVLAPSAQPAASSTGPSSMLAQSGLLGTAMASSTTGGGESGDDAGGLFDAIDEEENQKAAAEAEAERQKKLQVEEAERLKREQEEQERQRQLALQQQQQQQQQMMQQQQQQQQPYTYATQQPTQPSIMGGAINQQQPQFGQQQPPQQNQQPAIMQSVMLGDPTIPGTPQPQQQPGFVTQQLQAGMQGMTLNGGAGTNQGFYREHPPSIIGGTQPTPPNAFGGAPAASNQYYYGTQQQQMQTPSTPQPNITAGMHNATPNQPGAMMHPGNLGQVRKITLVKPQDVPPIYVDIKVTEPMLIQQQNFLISSPPYWSYQIASTLANNQGTWLVRRRFKHVVALEDRMRQACPGSILPARPDKHATRAIEEASTHQSAEFAIQRSQEMQQYLNALAKHPVAGQSQVLRLFLGLQDDIGTAWPEVSGNAFTKLGAVAAGMSMKVSETAQLTAGSAPTHEWEDDAELLTLCSSENIRMGAVSQAVPKLEGSVTIFREQGDASGALGMEMSKITKQVPAAKEDFKGCDILSNGLLRNGRRTKRLALELSAAMDSFLQQYKMVRYEKMAMNDRRQAIQRKGTVRRGADQRAMYLAQQQRQLQAAGQFGQLSHLEQSAIQTDSLANHAVGEAEEIAARLKSEIHRVAIDRRTQWNASMKTIASSMKEAYAERLAIWESTLEAFKTTPGCMPDENGMNPTMPMMVPQMGMPPQQQQMPMQQSMLSQSVMDVSMMGGQPHHQQQQQVPPPQHQQQQSQMDTSIIYA